MRPTLTLFLLLALCALGRLLGEEPRPADGEPAIVIVPHVRGEERRRRDEAAAREREEIRRRLVAWCPAYRAAVRPVRRALSEAAGSLALGWGPSSKHLGYPLQVALQKLAASGVLPVPDPALDKELRRALARLEEGAATCQRGMPATARLEMEAGRRGLDAVEKGLEACR